MLLLLLYWLSPGALVALSRLAVKLCFLLAARRELARCVGSPGATVRSRESKSNWWGAASNSRSALLVAQNSLRKLRSAARAPRRSFM